MSQPFAARLDALRGWRSAMLAGLDELEGFLEENDLRDPAASARCAALRQRLAGDRRTVAVVGEFSRGKSELINALLLAGDGQRILPATPGRTTMCPVELGYDAGSRPWVALLPIESRRDDATLAELRADPARWTRFEFDAGDTARLAEVLGQVAGTRAAGIAEARELGLWDDARPEVNPPLDARGEVEIPRWRHALVNHPHPLLQRGLAVLDTPGLNALGVEPELTLGLLPSAHAVIFVLGADTGVTRSDLELWRDHLADRPVAHFVVLNKIDALRDPLLDEAEIARQIETQRRTVAQTLGIDVQSVHAVSAREALLARIGGGDAAALQRSGLPGLEAALAERLLGDGRAVLQRRFDETLSGLRGAAAHRLGERRRQIAEQTLELRGLRGKSSARLRAARQRVAADAQEFEECLVQIQALRSVHKRVFKESLAALAGERLRAEIDRMQLALRPALFKLNARAVFGESCARLRASLAEARAGSEEIQAMLGAICARLNAQFGFALALPPPVAMQGFEDELALIETSYARYLGLTGALRLVQPRFMEQFKRMLLSRLRVVFESAGADVELWSRTSIQQIDAQLGERRSAFTRRAAAIERIEQATGNLEQRLTELAEQDAALQRLQQRLAELAQPMQVAPAPADALVPRERSAAGP